MMKIIDAYIGLRGLHGLTEDYFIWVNFTWLNQTLPNSTSFLKYPNYVKLYFV